VFRGGQQEARAWARASCGACSLRRIYLRDSPHPARVYEQPLVAPQEEHT